MFASHLDTVPPGNGWSVDPYAGVVGGTRLTARGAVDAKASVAAMATAAARLMQQGGPVRGVLVLLATYSEETASTTMPAALERFGRLPEMAIVGEPTSLQPCIAQRGQLLLQPVWEGEQVHAGWAAGKTPRPVNAITVAARDLAALESIQFERVHELLGEVAITPTMLDGGIARNITPPSCSAVLDIRTTPAYSHGEIIETIDRALSARIEVLSERLVPAETPADSRLLPAILELRPASTPYASPTCSDWVFLRGVDAVKMGPGSSTRSHTADEWIELPEVDAAAELYTEIAMEVLR